MKREPKRNKSRKEIIMKVTGYFNYPKNEPGSHGMLLAFLGYDIIALSKYYVSAAGVFTIIN